MSTKEKAERLLQEFLPRIREIEAEALARVREVAADAREKIDRADVAREKIDRADVAREELETVEADIGDLNEELERLPAEVVKADLEGDRELEGDLRGRYQAARSELEAAQARRGELKREIGSLLKNDRGHHLDTRIEHIANVAGVAFEERKAIDHLRERLVKAADAAADAAKKEHERHHGQVLAWSTSFEWEQARREREQARAS